MPNYVEEYREAAAKCLDLAKTATNLTARIAFLIMAQRWLDMAKRRMQGPDHDDQHIQPDDTL